MLINQDWFTADLFPETKMLRYLVTIGHVNERVYKDFRDKSYESVVSDCKYTFQYFPNCPNSLNLMAEVAMARSQPDLAIPFFERALQLYPQYAFTHAQYGHYLANIGAISAGIVELREALALDPSQAQAKAWLAELLPETAPQDTTKVGSGQGGSVTDGKKGSRIPGASDQAPSHP